MLIEPAMMSLSLKAGYDAAYGDQAAGNYGEAAAYGNDAAAAAHDPSTRLNTCTCGTAFQHPTQKGGH